MVIRGIGSFLKNLSTNVWLKIVNMKNFITLLGYLLCLNFSFSFACDCPYYGRINHIDLYTYDAIQLVEIENVYDFDDFSYTIKIKVVENFKKNEVCVFKVRNLGEACIREMKKGELWLVLAMYDGEFYNISFCNKSFKIEDTLSLLEKRDLDFLRNPEMYPNNSIMNNSTMIDSTTNSANMSIIQSIVLKKFTNQLKMNWVFFKAVLTHKGTLENVIIIKGHELIDEEILGFYLDEISKISGFIPYSINGHPVNIEFIFPLPFPE